MSAVSGFGKALVINTGASTGFSRALALSIAPRLAAGSALILAARSDDKLQELKAYLYRGVLRTVPRRAGLTRVNVSSLCALKLFPSWVLYCSGKVALDMLFRMLAEEEPDLRVLNYAPGPLDTDIQLQARSSSADDALRNSFSILHAQCQLLTCDQSISKLIKVLLEDKYPSGAHLDFYDL